jgi:hypothetical protein
MLSERTSHLLARQQGREVPCPGRRARDQQLFVSTRLEKVLISLRQRSDVTRLDLA